MLLWQKQTEQEQWLQGCTIKDGSPLKCDFHLIPRRYFVWCHSLDSMLFLSPTTDDTLITVIMWVAKSRKTNSTGKPSLPNCGPSRFRCYKWWWCCDYSNGTAHHHCHQWYDCSLHSASWCKASCVRLKLSGAKCLVLDLNYCVKSCILPMQKFIICRRKFELAAGCSKLRTSKETAMFWEC